MKPGDGLALAVRKTLEHAPNHRPQRLACLRAHDRAQEHRGQLCRVTHVYRRQAATQLDFVTEQRRHRVRLGVTANVAEQRMTIDFAQRITLKPEGRGQAHSEHASLQRVLHGLTNREIGSVRQRDHQLGPTNNHDGPLLAQLRPKEARIDDLNRTAQSRRS
jgi:hypothetical protein